MPRLILMHDGAAIREYDIDKERITIGRKPHNEIHIDDPTVSGEHAAILYLQHTYVEDLNSTNGTRLNGKKITKRQMKHGDVIKIGRHEFKFVDDKANAFERTVVIAPEAAAEPGSIKKPPRKVYVKVVSGPKTGETIVLNKSYTTLGSPGGQVAVIARRGASYHLMPMSGTAKSRPPVLNGKVLGAKSELLSQGDIIEVSGSQLEFNEEA